MRRISASLLIAALAIAGPAATNEALEEYRRLRTLPGVVRAEGSPTVCALLLELRRALRDMYPGYTLEITATGTSSAPNALMEGRCDLAAMSRPMDPEEIAAFKRKFGYEPERYTIARDAIVILASANNPIVAGENAPAPGLTLQQLDAMFGVDRIRGGDRITNWGQVGLKDEWADRTILMTAVGATSGTTRSFWRMVLQGGDWRSTVMTQPGPGAVVSGVGANETAIGVIGMAYRSKRTRPVPLAETDAGPFALPTIENCRSGRYPLVRDLYLYVNRKPGRPLSDLLRETLVYISSEEGQDVVLADGSIPIDLETSNDNLKRARATK